MYAIGVLLVGLGMLVHESGGAVFVGPLVVLVLAVLATTLL